MIMLHRMSKVRGWSHDTMMKMDKTIFYRYYGYWYMDCLIEEAEQEKRERDAKNREQNNQPRQWK